MGRQSITSDYISVIQRAIEKAQNDPTQLRSLVYDLARLSLGKHIIANYSQLGSVGLQRHVSGLETAIDQIESLSEKQDDLLTEDLSARLISGPARSPDNSVVTVRDHFDDALFDDASSNKMPAVLPPAPHETYREYRQVPEIWQPSEIWEPVFGRGPTRNRANLSWGLQLAVAALIGVAIYVVVLARTDHIPGAQWFS